MGAVKKLFKPNIPTVAAAAPAVEPTVAMPTEAAGAEQRRAAMRERAKTRGRDSTFLSDGAYQNTLLGN
jgi:hypothetical protein